MTTKRPITLEIDGDLWEQYKTTVPRGKRLNDAVVDLIKDEVKNYKSSYNEG